MNITPIITGAQVRAAYAAAPELLRNAFDSDATTDTITALQEQYRTQGDAIGELGKEIGYLLLGLTNPIEFIERLKRGGIDDTSAQAIALTINQKIFAPLQAEMRGNGTALGVSPASPQPHIEQRPSGAAPVLPTPTIFMPPIPPPSARSAEQAVVREAPAAVVIAPQPAPTPILPPALAEPAMRTMAHDVEAMKGSAGTPAGRQTQTAPIPTPPSPPPTPVAAPLPKQWAAPVAAPNDVPAFDKTPNISMSRIPAPDKKEVVSTLQKYGIDPYREVPE